MIQTTSTTSANVKISQSIIDKKTTTTPKWIPYYVKLPKITFSDYQVGANPNLYVVLTNGIVPYVTTTFTIDPNKNNYQDGITIPLMITDGTTQNLLAKETTSGISFAVVIRPSEIALTSIATQTGPVTWKLNHSIVILNNQSITIPTGHTLNATEYASIYNSGSIFLNGIINVDSTTTFVNGVYGLIYGTGSIAYVGTSTSANRISLYNNFVAPKSVSSIVYSSYGLTINSLGVYTALNVNTFPNNAVVTASSVVIVNNQTVTHATTESVGFDTLTHVIIQLGGIYRPYRISNAGIIINYGTIELQELITNHSQGIIINYGTIKPAVADSIGPINAYINNYGRIANASTGTISVRIVNYSNGGVGNFNYQIPIMNFATTSMAGITTTGKITGTISGKPTITINTTIPPLDPMLDSDITLYCSNAVNGAISTTVNPVSGMFIQMSGSSNVDGNPPNITFPSTITVKTPVTYRKGRTVNFTGPLPTSTPFKYSMYSSAGDFTVDAISTPFKFTMPQQTITTSPTYLTNYENRVAIYANAEKSIGSNPFSLVAETSIRDYTADLPSNKKVLYACAYNKNPLTDTTNTALTVNSFIYVNITQTCTLDALDFGYIFERFRPNRHRAGFNPALSVVSSFSARQFCNFYIYVYNSLTNENIAVLTINTLKNFNAMYDSADIINAETNDGSLITIPFALNNTSLPTHVYNVTPMAADKLSFKIGDQIHIGLFYNNASSDRIPWNVMTTNIQTNSSWKTITTPPTGYDYKNDICCSLVCVLQGKEKERVIIASNFGNTDTTILGGTVISAAKTGMSITAKTVLTGFLFNGFKITSTTTTTTLPTTIPMCINIYKILLPTNILSAASLFFQVFFDYNESTSTTSTSESTPLYIPFSYTEYNTIHTTPDETNWVSRIDATSLAFNGRQNPIFNAGEVFYLEIITNAAYTYTYKTFGETTSGSLRGIIVPTNLIELTSSGTLKYTGVASLPTNPYLLRVTPRTSQELFAIVNNGSIPLLNEYATAIGKLPANRTQTEKDAVNKFSGDGNGAELVPFNNIVTTFVTNMDALFSNATTFNQAIGSWDTSAVTSMVSMFNNANTFNQAIGSWDTSKVTNMNNMFTNAAVFNQPIESWNTANVTTINNMFYAAAKFNQPIGSWNTAKVTDMGGVFGSAHAFNSPINSWNTAIVVTMGSMFYSAIAFNQPINYNSNTNTWNTANVTDMYYMFYNATAFNNLIDSWNTAKVISMNSMFGAAIAFNQPINYILNTNTWNTANVVDMTYMFVSANAFNSPIETWNTAKVTTMYGMFSGASVFNSPINSWNTANVRDMSYMFNSATVFNSPINSWVTSNVTHMQSMFSYAGFNQPIGSWAVHNVTSMSSMFYNSKFNSSIGNWSVSNVKDMSNMFYVSSYNAILAPTFVSTTSNVTSMSGMFGGSSCVFNQDIRDLITTNVVNMNGMFQYNEQFNNGFAASTGTQYGQNKFFWQVSNVRDASYMFYGAKSFNVILEQFYFPPSCAYYGFNRYARPQDFYYTAWNGTNYYSVPARPYVGGSRLPESEFTT